MDFFFTLPSDLGRRLSLIDPLGFRGAATMYLARVAPGFSGRVRGRIWLPLLAWAAGEIEHEQRSEAARGGAPDDDRSLVKQRSQWLATFERALRLSSALAKHPKESETHWRYGNRVAWWRNHRAESTDYLVAKEPPFFPGPRVERASNALGCLRRMLERFDLFVPSEARLRCDAVSPSRVDRFCLTDRGRELAAAYADDLDRRRISAEQLREWGMFIRPTTKDYQNRKRRGDALEALKGAIPVTSAGRFDTRSFNRTHEALEHLLNPKQDPLLGRDAGLGPLGATVRALRGNDDLGRHALAHATGDDPWTERLRLAYRPLDALMVGTSEAPPLFVTLAEAFVAAMHGAFPGASLDCLDFPGATKGTISADLARAYREGRAAYLRARDRLREHETQRPEASLCPLVEQRATAGANHFDRWLETHDELTAKRLVELHVHQPRFSGGRVVPMIDLDGRAAYLEREFPWTEVERPDDEVEELIESDADDEELLEGEDEDADDGQIGGRTFQTQYWYTASAAARVIRGGGA